jgi:hypothetical protein
MQSFNFGLRRSAVDDVDETRSRFVPSSVYSGAVGESRAPSTAVQFTPMAALGGPFQDERPRLNPVRLLIRDLCLY